MNQKLKVKYIVVVFIFSILLSTLHFHNDLKDHSDCQICTIQSTLSSADVPTDVSYITLFSIASEATVSTFKKQCIKELNLSVDTRAPPQFS